MPVAATEQLFKKTFMLSRSHFREIKNVKNYTKR